MRHLTADELGQLGAALGATPAVDLRAFVDRHRSGDVLAPELGHLLVGIVTARPFSGRNDAIAVAAADLTARLNGRILDLEPAEDVVALVARIRDGHPADAVQRWLLDRLATPSAPSGPRCGSCAMPLRESLAVASGGPFAVVMCGGCGQVLGPPLPPRPLQEV